VALKGAAGRRRPGRAVDAVERRRPPGSRTAGHSKTPGRDRKRCVGLPGRSEWAAAGGKNGFSENRRL